MWAVCVQTEVLDCGTGELTTRTQSTWKEGDEQSWGIWKVRLISARIHIPCHAAMHSLIVQRVNSSFMPSPWTTSNQEQFAYDAGRVIPAAVYPGVPPSRPRPRPRTHTHAHALARDRRIHSRSVVRVWLPDCLTPRTALEVGREAVGAYASAISAKGVRRIRSSIGERPSTRNTARKQRWH